MGRMQLFTGVGAPALTAQPLAIEQMRAGELRAERGTAEASNRLAIELVGGRTVADQRP